MYFLIKKQIKWLKYKIDKNNAFNRLKKILFLNIIFKNLYSAQRAFFISVLKTQQTFNKIKKAAYF